MIDYDGKDNPDEKIDEIVVELPRNVGGRSLTRRTYDGRFGYASMDLSFRVSCAEYFYGSDCGTLCVPPDDALGHFTCSSDGELVCLPGYQNPLTNCTECAPAVGCCKLLL